MIEFAPTSKNKMTYDEALLYCQFLDYNGYNDWRMPSVVEYRSDAYQSSSDDVHWSDVWNSSDLVDYNLLTKGYRYYVKPVRDI